MTAVLFWWFVGTGFIALVALASCIGMAVSMADMRTQLHNQKILDRYRG